MRRDTAIRDARASVAKISVDTKSDTRVAFGNDATVDTKTVPGDQFGNDATTIGFIRVRKRTLKGEQCFRTNPSTESKSFDVVRAVRVNGKPRHQFVFGLGSQKNDEGLAHQFWQHAIIRMKHHGLSEPQRRHLAAEMIRKGARLPTLQRCEDAIALYRGPRWDSRWLAVAEEIIAIIKVRP